MATLLVRALDGILGTHSIGRFLVLVDQAAGQLPAPPALDEPVPPQHQHPVTLINKRHHRGPVQPHHVMPVPATIRQLNVDLP